MIFIRDLAGLLAVSAMSGIAVSGQAVQSHSAHASPITTTANATIDGSVHPELISDEEAITVFWISVMEPPSAGALEKSRFAAKTSSMDLEADDSLILWNMAQSFYTQFQPYLTQAQQLAAAAVAPITAATAATSAADLKQQRGAVAASIDQLAMDTYDNVLASLSPKAAANLRSRIQDVKKHMRIIPPPTM